MGIYGYIYGYLLVLWIFMGTFMGMINIENLIITPEILAIISEIDEFKGTWSILGKQAPEQLTSLKLVATIESIGSSTRIEGSKLNDREVEKILNNIQIKKFSTRDEQEVAGYGDVMNLIFQNYNEIPLTENYIKQLHNELLQHSEKDYWHRGNYKKSPNHVEAFDQDGKSLGIIFETASPFETPFQMEELLKWTNKGLLEKRLHPLLIISIFIVFFLAIHPFQDGNGRLSRALTSFILLMAGYTYVPYSSLEAVIEQSKEAYYLALRQTQGTLKEKNPNWKPWILFFLRALQKQKQRLEEKIKREKVLLEQLPELSLQILNFIVSRGKGTMREIYTVTGANRNTIKKHLETLVSSHRLIKNGTGRGTWYTANE